MLMYESFFFQTRLSHFFLRDCAESVLRNDKKASKLLFVFQVQIITRLICTCMRRAFYTLHKGFFSLFVQRQRKKRAYAYKMYNGCVTVHPPFSISFAFLNFMS